MANYKVCLRSYSSTGKDLILFFPVGLLINDCDENDSGPYTITIDNQKSSTAEVIVEPKVEKVRSPTPAEEAVQQAAPTGFRQGLPNSLTVDQDKDFVLQCEVNDAKQLTDWYLDDDLLDSSNPHYKIVNNGTIRQLKGLILHCPSSSLDNRFISSSESRIK